MSVPTPLRVINLSSNMKASLKSNEFNLAEINIIFCLLSGLSLSFSFQNESGSSALEIAKCYSPTIVMASFFFDRKADDTRR